MDGSHPPLEVEDGESLRELLQRHRAPVLFGCQAGMCGTCLIEVDGPVEPPPTGQEAETLRIVTTKANRRLACQLKVHQDLLIRYAGGE